MIESELFSRLFEIFLALGIAAFLYYAVVLNRRIGSVRESREELEKLVASFMEATQRADQSINGFKATADQSGRALQELVSKATVLRDDLSFMIDRAEKAAERLETSIAHNRQVQAGANDTAGSVKAGAALGDKQQQSPPAQEPRSRAEKELLRALGGLR